LAVCGFAPFNIIIVVVDAVVVVVVVVLRSSRFVITIYYIKYHPQNDRQ
jgi:hypothetical protein